MSIIDVENSYFFSSDKELGAKNVVNNGSQFQITLDKPIVVPQGAIDVSVECRSANVWFTCPNISPEYNNDTFYFNVHSKTYQLLPDDPPFASSSVIVELFIMLSPPVSIEINTGTIDLDDPVYTGALPPKE